jgi:hypothetical protein
MALYSIPEPREHWVGLYRSALECGVLHRGRAAELAARAIELLAEATVNVCVLAASCGAIDASDMLLPAVAADVLAGAEHGATVAFFVVDAALVRHGAEVGYRAGEWREDAMALAAQRARQGRCDPRGRTPVLVHDVSDALAQTIALLERDPLAVPEFGAFVLADLIELYVRIRAGLSGLPVSA